ncbi:pilus assembly protein TadG-related protein [Pectinatus brassicae]|uniref:Cytoskeletal protein CcmA (Bactofilin family) n=1 Tax=Pectinatus brassicae TaxID=862415 RepID=A0A840UFE0_9FIRM|nr:pilus assembly protein TadG-related protein [Pectinatus brassicae]MBB5335729.1 cytoskeletal protein CcmA (bactofilin family) [Pectinatus brassicae]
MNIFKYLKQKNGQMIVLFALTLPILLGMAGLAIDLGNLYYQKSYLQNMADAGAAAGAMYIVSATNHIEAEAEAQKYINLNSKSDESITVTYPTTIKKTGTTYDPSTMIIVNVSKNVKTYFIQLLTGTNTYTISARATAQMTNIPSGPFAYSLFSGSSTDPLTISGNTHVTGNAHSNQNLEISGNASLLGNAEAVGNITLGGSSSVTSVTAHGNILISGSSTVSSSTQNSSNVTNIPMPDFANEIQTNAEAVGQSYTKDPKWKNSTLSGAIYVNDDVKISSNNTISSTGQLLVNGTITISGNLTAADNTNQQQLAIYSLSNANDAITISGNTTIDGIIYAPKGNVKITGNVTVNGSIVAKTISISGHLTVNGTNPISVPTSGKKSSSLIE